TVAYGASIFLPDNDKRRLPTSLNTAFHSYLRTVIGAYKSTPVYLLHSEAGVRPPGLYLAYRRAVFLARPDYQAKAQAIRSTVYQTLSTHTRHPRPVVTTQPAPEEMSVRRRGGDRSPRAIILYDASSAADELATHGK
ncbi:hypothetical protein SEPCBS57363_006787, partial [Sporothrix epigloea]